MREGELKKAKIKKSIHISRKMEWVIYALGICAFLFTILSTKMLSVHLNEPNGLFYGNLTINILLESICVFVFGKNHFELKLNEGLQKIILTLSNYSFGAYLVHVFVIDVLNKVLHLNTMTFNPILSVPIIGVIVFCVSFIVSAVFHQIPVLKKYVV